MIPLFPADEACLICRKACLDRCREHAIHCRELSDFKYRHDFVRDVLFNVFKCLRVSLKKEEHVNFLMDPQEEEIYTKASRYFVVRVGRRKTCMRGLDWSILTYGIDH
jgi:hypothetical protein